MLRIMRVRLYKRKANSAKIRPQTLKCTFSRRRANNPILLEEVRTFESIPAWLAVIVALLCALDDGSHSDLLLHPLPFDDDG